MARRKQSEDVTTRIAQRILEKVRVIKDGLPVIGKKSKRSRKKDSTKKTARKVSKKKTSKKASAKKSVGRKSVRRKKK